MNAAVEPSLNHVAISVSDTARASRFYADVLGLREVERPDFGIPGAWFSAGGVMIHLAELNVAAEQRDPFAHFALQVDTTRIPALVDAIRGGGGTVQSEPQTRDQLGTPVTSAFCVDTEGNLFEITDLGLAAARG